MGVQMFADFIEELLEDKHWALANLHSFLDESEDERWMRMALSLAATAGSQTHPNPRVGCVLVKEGQLIGQGAHLRAGTPHAEIHALRQAGPEAKGATAYVTLEPCSHYGRTPPCADALIQAGIKRVVLAMVDPDLRVSGRGAAKLQAAGIDVKMGVMEEEARRLNKPYLHVQTTHMPYVVWKTASTLDGRMATSTGDSRWVSGEKSRQMVHYWRSRVDAVMVGIGTVLADNPQLTVRLSHMRDVRQPIRIVIDTHLHTPPAARLLSEPGRTLIYCGQQFLQSEQKEELISQGDVEVVGVATDVNGRLDLRAMLADLANRQVVTVLLESGPTLSTSFLEQGLVQEIAWFMAPKLLLSGKSTLLSQQPITRMSDALQLDSVKVRMVGQDILLTAVLGGQS
ncbi:bifunctional diaminohydroxyphosphoribosylaminopyrimidine deaminase/5-amino-6-(5-phosphoribosylamino)uracil reductase RibD [Alicyclobacillus tolerans]|nr:bifunctional diaminohydroxyphosphoribosylaminopyrimidine deaminase/5-amino-6-(5-phosphoribosylamino)uracil reductase RibD [Alicyclobacillus montanus]